MPPVRITWRLAAAIAAVLLLAAGHAGAALELTESEAAGKRIYTQGTSASGSSITARVGPAGTPMPGSVVPCANCHGADGRGRPEGGVRPTDITWRRLTAPYGQRLASGRTHPAYDEAAFARAVTQGIDPAGTRLDQSMPRFVMSMRDVADLTAYMKRLEEDRDPGLLGDVLRIGTLLPQDGHLAELGATVAGVLRGVFDGLNEQGGIHGRRIELVVVDAGADRASAEAALHRLVEQEPVFAVVAPLAPGLEGELARLVDAQRIPVVGPLARLTEGSGSRFLFDPLPGLREQLLALGEFAATLPGLTNPQAAIVAPRDEPSQRIAADLAGRLQARGWQQVGVHAYTAGELGTADLVGEFSRRGVQAVFFLGRNDDFGALVAAANGAMLSPYLFAASTQVGAAALEVAPMFSERVFLAYPSLPQDWTPEGIAALDALRQRAGLSPRHAAFQVSAYVSALVLVEGLKRSGRDTSRDKLVAAIEGLHGFRTGLTPALSFGPGQRVGAPGAHIVTVDLQRRAFQPTGRYVKVERLDQ